MGFLNMSLFRKNVDVALGHRSYNITIGRNILQESVARVDAFKPRRVLVVTDTNVDSFHHDALHTLLETAGVQDIHYHVVAAGEPSKSYETLIQTCEAGLSARLGRKDFIIAFGGGVVGDLAGFAASILLRGIRFIQIPTSLLAQVDSSVGGKTGINSLQGKNLIGSFYQPVHVIADTALVDTLNEREKKAGYAEVVKYGLINDRRFFEWCETHWQGVINGTGTDREEAVAYSCEAKAAIVGRDERESGERALLNLGHTFGHAFEKLCYYNPELLIHGEGVAVGLILAYRFSSYLGFCDEGHFQRIIRHLKAVGLPTSFNDLPQECRNIDALLSAMELDKKVESGDLTFILARDLGQSYIEKSVSRDKVRSFLNDVVG